MKKEFKKSDLKNCMTVVLENGECGLILKDVDGYDFVVASQDEYLVDSDSYDESMYSSSMWSVVEVYDVPDVNTILKLERGKLLWEREEKVELTLDEIAEKFDVLVSQLKIKE